MNIKAYSTHKDFVNGSHCAEYNFESIELAGNVAYQLRQAGKWVCINRATIDAKVLAPIVNES